ncbi:MAG: hypothetical protein V4760_05430 [Bdellovibrionota bacterium]
MAEPMTPSFTRCDLLTPALIFGGLLITLTAVGGALEGTSAQWVDEIKVVAGENVVGTEDMDPLATCKKTTKHAGSFTELARNCSQNTLKAERR